MLFALSIVLVFAGTLAQRYYDIWFVIDQYFRGFIAWIELKIFFPDGRGISGSLPFPGGWSLGGLLGANLLAAHALRFKVTGRGRSLWIGSVLIAIGSILTYLVIQSGLDDAVESQLSPAFSNGLWHALRAGLGGGTLLFAYVLALNYQTKLRWLWWVGVVACALLLVLTLWLFSSPEAKLDPSGLRILWQLIKGSVAGFLLLAGCYGVFGRRAGVVLLHSGIALMMFNELYVGTQVDEAQMRITEGQTVSFAEDYRNAELAIIDKSDPQQDHVTVVPAPLLKRAAESGKVINDPALPFSLRVVRYMPNATARFKQPAEQTPVDAGNGQFQILEEHPINVGTDSDTGTDLPGAYVELLTRDNQQPLGTYLLWALPASNEITESLSYKGRPYEVSLRFKRLHKPYSIKLVDFRHDQYVGTPTPKNFSSDIRLLDPDRDVDRPYRIWMNNPLRYNGDTLYQASYDPNDPRVTTLQVVTNPGWMVPYVSCMIVGIGMMAHFGTTFYRFTQRQQSVAAARENSSDRLRSNWRRPAVWVPALIVLLVGVGIFRRAQVPELPPAEMQVHEFGALPVVYQGRVKPFDTFARNLLTILSGRGTLYLHNTERSAFQQAFNMEKKAPAIIWLLDLLANKPELRDHRFIAIEDPDVVQILDLEPRQGSRYSLRELFSQQEEYQKQAELILGKSEEELNRTQKSFKELLNKVSLLNVVSESFSAATDELSFASRDEALQRLIALQRKIESLRQSAPLAVPPREPGEEWQMLLAAESQPIFDILNRVEERREPDPAVIALRTMLNAYRENDVQEFNFQVDAYREIVKARAEADALLDQQIAEDEQIGQRKAAEKLVLARLNYETFFNHFNPFVLAMILYIVAFALASASWLGWRVVLDRSSHWLLWFGFALHTFALVSRIYISGRPPVTNLYSSAVFIGWAGVLFALVFERIYRFGLGNLLAAVIGFPTLIVAYNLAGDGDTFQVLQAVLDTQFWLATHVVCITFGYSTTFLAGALGCFYVVFVQLFGALNERQRQQLIRMMYGTLCFAIFFSFIGTVLGGLWADDSWGRFWGWDPKENGALMIVLWNALVLHARWGGMIRGRGLAVLAIFGNVVTAWSWFGVNQMSVGLHSYGFRSGLAMKLIVFAISQVGMMALGMMLKDKSLKPEEPKELGASI